MLGWNHVFLYFDEPDDPSIRHVRTWEGQSVPHVDPDCDEKREQRSRSGAVEGVGGAAATAVVVWAAAEGVGAGIAADVEVPVGGSTP